MKLTELNIKSTNTIEMMNGFFEDADIPTIPTEQLIVGPTGYFEGLVDNQSLVGIGCISKGIDVNGRRVIVIGTEHGNIIAFKRLITEHSTQVAYNAPRIYATMINQLVSTACNLTPNCGLYKLIANIIMMQQADCSPVYELIKLSNSYLKNKALRPIVTQCESGAVKEIAFPVEDGIVMISMPEGLSVLPKLLASTTSQKVKDIVSDCQRISPEELLDVLDLHYDHEG